MGTAGMSKKVGQTKKLQRFEINGQEYKGVRPSSKV